MKMKHLIYAFLLLAVFAGGYLVGKWDESATQRSAEDLARKFLTYRPQKFGDFWGPITSYGDWYALPLYTWFGKFDGKEIRMLVDMNDNVACLHEVVAPHRYEKIVCSDVK
ncbi:MAG: hypothetical protein ACK4GK_09460 [Ferrovibrio sp.]